MKINIFRFYKNLGFFSLAGGQNPSQVNGIFTLR